MECDFFVIGCESFVWLKFGFDIDILLGFEIQFFIDCYFVGQGGELQFMFGQMLFDWLEGLFKIDFSVKMMFGMIGVCGMKFFVGFFKGIFLVYVEYGCVDVLNVGVLWCVIVGEGFDILLVKDGFCLLGDNVRDVVVMVCMVVLILFLCWVEVWIKDVYVSVGLC